MAMIIVAVQDRIPWYTSSCSLTLTGVFVAQIVLAWLFSTLKITACPFITIPDMLLQSSRHALTVAPGKSAPTFTPGMLLPSCLWHASLPSLACSQPAPPVPQYPQRKWLDHFKLANPKLATPDALDLIDKLLRVISGKRAVCMCMYGKRGRKI
eukprot:scaffold74017_cov15-Tisochrysis_lutea.AAC.1